MQTMLKEYIRDEQTRQPRGIVVSIRENDQVLYGYSLLNTKLDKFDKRLGLNIAINRAYSECYTLPDTKEREYLVLEAFERLQSRSLKYFKDLDPEKVRMFPFEESTQ